MVTDKFTLDELIEFNKKFSEEDDPEIAKAEIEGIIALRENLELIRDDNHAVLLSVG